MHISMLGEEHIVAVIEEVVYIIDFNGRELSSILDPEITIKDQDVDEIKLD